MFSTNDLRPQEFGPCVQIVGRGNRSERPRRPCSISKGTRISRINDHWIRSDCVSTVQPTDPTERASTSKAHTIREIRVPPWPYRAPDRSTVFAGRSRLNSLLFARSFTMERGLSSLRTPPLCQRDLLQLSRERRKHFAAVASYQHVVFDADAPPSGQIDARLDREDHARLQDVT